MKKKVMAVLTAAGMAGMLLSPFTAMAADQNVSVSYTKANEYELCHGSHGAGGADRAYQTSAFRLFSGIRGIF